MLNTKYMIRRMAETDLDKVMVIEKESFSLPWSKESYMGELKNDFANYLVCDDGGEIAAYGGIWVVFEEAHITNVAVAVKYRGQGVGSDLMGELEKSPAPNMLPGSCWKSDPATKLPWPCMISLVM